jgi:hypothetical protein
MVKIKFRFYSRLLTVIKIHFQLPPIENPIPIVGKTVIIVFIAVFYAAQQIVDFKTLGFTLFGIATKRLFVCSIS